MVTYVSKSDFVPYSDEQRGNCHLEKETEVHDWPSSRIKADSQFYVS